MEPLWVRFGDGFELAEAEARLVRGGRALPLAPKAFAVLCTLVRRAPQLVGKNELLDAVWSHRHVSESVLKTTISELRLLLGDDAVTAVLRRDGGAPRLSLHRAHHRGRCCTASAGAGVHAHGQCVEQFGAGEPYLPVLEALGSVCRDDPGLVALMRSVAPTWLLQRPWFSTEAEREALRGELAGASQHRMLREFGDLLDRYTQARPLRTLSGAAATSVVTTAWENEISYRHEELAGLVDRGGETARTLAQSGLSPDAVRQALDNLVQGQSVMLATNQIMLMVALGFCASAFFIWLARKPTRAVDMSRAGH